MRRPDHDDFWLMAEVVQDLDAAGEDVGIERTLPVDPESISYFAFQRGLRVPNEPPQIVFPIAWIDGFAAGYFFHKRQAEKPR